jgi:hypothetical protein
LKFGETPEAGPGEVRVPPTPAGVARNICSLQRPQRISQS